MECSQSLDYGFDGSFEVLVDVDYREPQHAKARLAQPVISSRVIEKLIAVVFTIDFDHQPCLQAGEVSEVGADWNLASKLASHQLPAAQAVPQPPFGPGHLTPQLLCALIAGSALKTGLIKHAGRLSRVPSLRKGAR